MCEFYSFLTDDKGNRYAMGHKERQMILKGDLNLRADSHSSVAEYWFGDSKKEDNYNKFEFNPLTRELKLDQQNLLVDDTELININELIEEAKEAVPGLIIKPIIHPFKDVKFDGEITEEILDKLKEWDSVRDSVWDSVRASVWDSVWDSVGASVRASVRDSVWDSVGASVWASVRDSVRDSVWASVWAYISSFFNLESWRYTDSRSHINPFQSCIDLWEMGLVPNYDGTVWRLHSYKGVVWEGKI